MTAEEIKRLGELEAKATKGPWYITKGTGSYRDCLNIKGGTQPPSCSPDRVCKVYPVGYTGPMDSADKPPHTDNAELIIALRNACPELLALAARAERYEKALKKIVLEPCHDTCDGTRLMGKCDCHRAIATAALAPEDGK